MGVPLDLREWIQHVQAERARVLEEMCERSLTDEKQRGVLVVQDHMGVDIKVSLSERVPYGHVYVVKEGYAP